MQNFQAMNRLRIATLLLLALGLGARTASAQEPAPNVQIVDRVVAVVGDSAILKTDLDEEVYRTLAASGQQLPEDAATRERLYRNALDSRVNELLLLLAAQRDSVTVADSDVQRQVDQQLSQQRRAFGSDVALEQALRAQGLTLAGYRAEMTRQVRIQGLIESYLAKVRRSRRPPPLTDKQVKEFFDAQKDQLGERPATLDLELVVLAPRASDSARAAARAEAEQLLQRIRSGEDFATLARRFSQDPGSKDQGGDLGWFRDGQMVPEFSRAAFALPPGAVSGVVETAYGFHIIKVEKMKGAERQARHILITPVISEGDVAGTRTTAEEVLEKLRAGEPVDSLVSRYGDPTDSDQGAIGPFPREQLPAPFDEVLAGASTGDLYGPVTLPGPRGDRWALVKVTDVTEQGPYRWEDQTVREQFRQRLTQQLLMEEIIKELRERTFIDLRL
jgi:peptidyl-prolyl cis-trans isomerase SurA